MKQLSLQHLAPEETATVGQHLDMYTFQVRTDLFYDGQIPQAGLLVIEGIVKIKKRNKVVGKAQSGDLIGLIELWENRPGKGSVEVGPDSRICLIDRSTLKEALGKPSMPLGKILKKCVF